MAERHDTIVVGAGPAGLAVAACLRRAGKDDVVILEREAELGSAWRKHYERLHLHTVKRHSSLPYLAFPSNAPTYVPRAQVVEYLEAYARAFDLRPATGEALVRATREPSGGGWRVETSRGVRQARHLVLATGFNREPHRPRFAGQDDFRGQILHSGAYRSGAAFRGQRVLVIGLGNTGGEIAIDLVEQGAAAVDLCVRGPVHVVKRDLLGVPTQLMTVSSMWMPKALLDRTFGLLARLAVGDLARHGIRRPAEGIIATIEKHKRIPLIDVGTIDLIKAGRIAVRPDVRTFDATGVTFVDGAHGDYDAVVLATGYRPRLDAFLPDAAAVLDEHGYPRVHGGESALPGLYFVGFHSPVTGMLREIGLEARRVAAAIAAST